MISGSDRFDPKLGLNDLINTMKEVSRSIPAREVLLMKEGAKEAFQIQANTLPEAMQNLGDIILFTDKDAKVYLDKVTAHMTTVQHPSWEEGNMVHKFGNMYGQSKLVCLSKEKNPLVYIMLDRIFEDCVYLSEHGLPQNKVKWRELWANFKTKEDIDECE